MYANSLKYFCMKLINWERKDNFNSISSTYTSNFMVPLTYYNNENPLKVLLLLLTVPLRLHPVKESS